MISVQPPDWSGAVAAPRSSRCNRGRVPLLEPAPMDAEENAGEDDEQKIADQRATGAKLRIADSVFAFGVVHLAEIDVGKRITVGPCWNRGALHRSKALLTANGHFVDLEICHRSAHTPETAACPHRIAQIDRCIEHLLDREEHRDHRDEANRVAIHLRDTTVDSIHGVSVKQWLRSLPLPPSPHSPIALTAPQHP